MKRFIPLIGAITLLAGCSQNIFSSNKTTESNSEQEITESDYSAETPIVESSAAVDSTTASSDSTASSETSSFSEYDWDVPSYYKNIDLTLRKADLKTYLFKTIKSHTDLGYDNLWSAYPKTDVREDGTIWDMYSDCRYSTSNHGSSYPKEGSGYNREHTIPQSIFSKQSPMKADLFHVYPTDGYVNNQRSNYPHAEVSSNNIKYTSTNGCKVGTSATSGVSGYVCEPPDEYKGDFARTYFYFVTCYQDKVSSFKTYACFSNNTYPSLSTWAKNLYLKWSKDDPVSQKEIDRNEAVYKLQGNRNPFIDMPGIENLIWG